MLFQAFPDAQQVIEDEIAEGDMVVSRKTFRGTHRGDFIGIPATGKSVAILAIEMFRVVNGKLVEHWGVGDLSSLVQQLKPIPEPGK